MTPKLEPRQLSKLKSYPKQGCFFHELSDPDLRALAADIKRNGLRQPIEILGKNAAGLPPNTIIRGHQRARALLLNGETETKVLVRYDLADADATTIEREFLEENQNRRHESPLEQARVFLRLFEIDKKAKPGKLPRTQELRARDLMCEKLKMNSRNVDRYFRILKTPIEVQNEFDAGRISLVLAGQVAGLNAKAQEEIAVRIRKGEKAKDVLTSFLGKKSARHGKLYDAYECFAKSLARSLEDLEDRVHKVSYAQLRETQPNLQRGKLLMDTLLSAAHDAVEYQRKQDEEE